MTTGYECLLCHAVHTESSSGAWRCNRCGQRWDATQLATVADYQRWVKVEAAAVTHTAVA